MVGTSKLGSCCMAIDIRDAPRVTGTFQDHLKDSPHLCRRPARVLMRKEVEYIVRNGGMAESIVLSDNLPMTSHDNLLSPYVYL